MNAVAAEQQPDTTVTLLEPRNGSGRVRRTVLPGGLRVVTETMPSVRSVTFGIWAGVGSRDEDAAHTGATHFLEHLLFKGTRRRDALDISAALDAVGADHNAFTTKESTAYYARVLDSDLPVAVDILCDMVGDATLDAAEVATERGVILEEIAMYEDDPSELVDDVFAARLFGDSPLGRPILGTVETMSALPRERIVEHYQRCYQPHRLTVAAAGNLDHDATVELVREGFRERLAEADDRAPTRPRLDGPGAVAHPGTTVVTRDTEQAHLILGGLGLSRTDERRVALNALNVALGSGASSRLFQEVRERRGLAYTVEGFTAEYADTGVFGVAVDCLPDKIDEVLEVCQEELATVADSGIGEEELRRAKGRLRGSLVLATEDSEARMHRLATHELGHPRLRSLDEHVAMIDAVTLDDVRAVAAEVLHRPRALAVIGPYERDREFPLA